VIFKFRRYQVIPIVIAAIISSETSADASFPCPLDAAKENSRNKVEKPDTPRETSVMGMFNTGLYSAKDAVTAKQIPATRGMMYGFLIVV